MVAYEHLFKVFFDVEDCGRRQIVPMQALCIGPFIDLAIEASDDHTRTIRHEHLQLLAGAKLLSAYLETRNSNVISEKGWAERVITIKLSPGLQLAVSLQSIGENCKPSNRRCSRILSTG